jgi:FlaA1/EpsC-like NDP-sugar epimerase
MRRGLFYAKIGLTALVDGALFNVAMYFALWLRFDTPHVPPEYLLPYEHVAVAFTIGSLAILFGLRIYHRLWQYAMARDGLVLVVGITLSALLLTALIYLSGDGAHYPRAVFAMYWLLAVVLVGGLRFIRRSMSEVQWQPRRAENRPRVLILGAGKAGEMVAQELIRHPEVGQAVGFLDDDPRKVGMQMSGLKVLGRLADLAEVVAGMPVDQVIIAMPSADGSIVRQVVDDARRLGIRVRIVPSLNQVIDGQVRASQIRDVQIEDLLQRPPAHVDLGEIASYLTGRRVLVTGAGGTIGAELARQVSRFEPHLLILLGLDETGIFDVARSVREVAPDVRVLPVVADLRNARHLARLFEETRPQVIFHAAAHKHVPLMEAQPDEAIRNNVGGLWSVAALADRFRAETFVFISSDKAVNPTSVYGATKRVGELLVTAYAGRSATRFVSVRFGNVLASRGSVVPIFQEQIQKGGPVTVTHPDMVRYFMTATEAAQLVIQAGAMGTGGEIFVLDMGAPIRIVDLAQNLIRLSGLKPGVDIDIVFTGIRPGEKLYEELLTREDRSRASRHERIYIARQDAVDADRVFRLAESLLQLADEAAPAELVAALAALVPEYRPNRDDVVTRIGSAAGQGATPHVLQS